MPRRFDGYCCQGRNFKHSKGRGLIDASYSTVSAAQTALNQANGILNEIGETAYVKTSFGMQIPFMPVIYKMADKGTLMLDASVSVVALGRVVSDEIKIVGTDLQTDTSFTAKTATDVKVGLGYSQSVWENSNGMLVAGAKANVH
ncbi:conjugal transfer protein TraF [Marinomonas sp. 2405UD68-3]|uniref:conjugal transfer protein TraF n=1 Tax=Marinomonas sp. 2405UD68-3 TaxID=3391835 RepID=UPI0039C9C6D3